MTNETNNQIDSVQENIHDLLYVYAKFYRSLNLVPLPGHNKSPTIPWLKYQQTLPTGQEIDEWFTNDSFLNLQNPQLLLLTGPLTKLTVVDIDVKNIQSPIDPLEIITKLSFPEDVKTNLLVSTTPSGGKHIWLKTPTDFTIPNSVKRLHPQIDIRSHGGLIVVPPSPNYTFDNINNDTQLLVKALKNLPELPPLLINAIKKQIPIDKSTNNPNNPNNSTFHVPTKFTSTFTPNEWQRIFNEGVTHGSRNQTTTHIIGKLLHAFKVALPDTPIRENLPLIWQFVVFWNTKNNPPLSTTELQHTFESIVSRVL